MSQDVLFEQTGPTAIITLNRPDKLNAWTEAMRNDLIGYLESLKGSDEVRTVILTGSGRAFCAGQDLAETASMNPEDHESAEAWIDGFDRLYRAVRNLDQIGVAYGRQGASQRHARGIRNRFEHSNMDDIFQHGVHEFIQEFIADNSRLGEIITRQYLI